jgi:hypothetical protein
MLFINNIVGYPRSRVFKSFVFMHIVGYSKCHFGTPFFSTTSWDIPSVFWGCVIGDNIPSGALEVLRLLAFRWPIVSRASFGTASRRQFGAEHRLPSLVLLRAPERTEFRCRAGIRFEVVVPFQDTTIIPKNPERQGVLFG